MTESFRSDSWYRVAALKPRLQPHVRITRQNFRGRRWYVLHDPATGRSHRLTAASCAVLDAMNGERTLEDIWAGTLEALGDDAPSQEDLIRLLHRLHAADVLQAGVLPDLDDALERRGRQQRALWMRNFLNPLALRFPLWDPEPFLRRGWPWVRGFFTPAAALVWLTVVTAACVLAGQHWSALTGNLSDRVLASENLLLLWLTYPVVKFLHELGHAWAVRRCGGEVHDMGVMLLVFAPVPYVDASASNAFADKGSRILVASAGILVETFLASVAMFVWLAVEPGVLRAVCFNVMLIGGVSTVLFNANPLLRFDGYYILSDLIEIPNLAQRANQYLGYLVRRHAFGDRAADCPAEGRAERVWMLLYAPLSFAYRVTVMVSIAIFIAGKYFFVGVAMALWSVISQLGLPALKGLAFIFSSAQLDHRRVRAVLVTGGVLAAVVLPLFIVPVPHWTLSEGVVWVPAQAEVRAATAGFVERVQAPGGTRVRTDDPLMRLTDPELRADIAAREARVQQQRIQLATETYTDRLRAELTRQTLEAEQSVLDRLRIREEGLVARSARDGTWMVANAVDLPGRYFSQGSLLGHVVSGHLRTVRVVVPQADADLVRHRTRMIRVRLADRRGEEFVANRVRDVPAGSEELPSKALTQEGGGPFATDPRDRSGLKTLGRTFQFDLDLQTEAIDLQFGCRAWVRFEHDRETLAALAWRSLRQVLLSRLTV